LANNVHEAFFAFYSSGCDIAVKPLNTINMKKVLMGLALLTTLSAVSVAGPAVKGKKAKAKAKAAQCEVKKENCEKMGTSSCCMKKKTQA
jgi:ribosomal protein L12E/L44/L45/RPP1/RPP2